MTTNARVPDLGRLSLALLEHGVKPILGDKAIQVLRAPADEKELRDHLEATLRNTENRFVKEGEDSDIRQAILSLPLDTLPSLQTALRSFYSHPTDSTFREILQGQLAADYPNLSSERIDDAISSYMRILREELVPISNEIRDKLSTYALLAIEQNTARMADAIESFAAAHYDPTKDFVREAPSPPKQKGKEPKRELVYEVSSRSDINEIRSEWKFLSSSASTVAVSDGIIDIGSIDGQTCSFPQIDPVGNCSVDCELRILDVANNDMSHWAGIRLRGFVYDFRFGYLTYLRRSGTVELFRAQEVIGGANEQMASDTLNPWMKLRIDVFGSRMRVWIDGNLHINVTDRKFGDRGLIYLHTYYTHAQFRNLRIFKLKF